MKSPDFLRSNFLKAEFLHERAQASRKVASRNVKFSAKAAKLKLASWKKLAAYIDSGDRLPRRLTSEGLSEAEFTRILGAEPESLYDKSYLPSWAREAKRNNQYRGPPFTSKILEEYCERGLISVFLPQIAFFSARLTDNIRSFAGTSLWLRHPAAVTDAFLESFVASFEQRVRRAVVLEINSLSVLGKLKGENPSERFNHYRRMTQDEAYREQFLAKYPVLTRYVQTALQLWCESSIELIVRLLEDCEGLQREFGISPEDSLARIQTSGDTHANGRAVSQITFESGTRLVYKPRNLGLDACFQQFIRWINKQSVKLQHRTVKILERDRYGWVEFVECTPTESEQDFVDFYSRLGSLICILNTLEAVDIHFENLVSAKSFPVVVDLETLFHPDLDTFDLSTASGIVSRNIRRSVMRIGILPRPTLSHNGVATFDISAVGASVDQVASYTVVGIDNFGRDDIRITNIPGWIPSAHNRPDPTSNRAIPINAILEGFLETYNLLLTHKDVLLSDTGPMAPFKYQRRRLIVRDTIRYGGLQSDEFHPDLLRDALDRAWHWDNLWNDARTRPVTERFFGSEMKQLLQYDIPHFTMRVDSTTAIGADGSVIDLHDVESGWIASRAKLEALSNEDRDQQTWYIRASLGIAHDRSSGQLFQSNPGDFLKLATAIGDEVLRRLVRHNDTASFVKVASVIGENKSRSEAFSIADADGALYDGRAGVALFLAYLSHESGDVKYRDAAQALVRTIEAQSLASNGVRGIGGYTGFPSLIYVYAHLCCLWGERAYVGKSEKLLLSVSEMIRADRALDVLNGAAGCLLALLPLYRVSKNKYALAVAKQCARHLSGKDESGRPRWQSIAVKRGLSHGLSGVALALGRLGALTTDGQLVDEAEEILRFESALLSKGKWTDTHQILGRPQVSWCHGAPGIALARLGISLASVAASTRADLDASLAETVAHFRLPSHCLCHGTLGNLEALLVARDHPEVSHYANGLDALLEEVMRDLSQAGFRSLLPNQTLSLGLMTGLAGVGYSSLRIHAPDRVPSVLLLQPPPEHLARGLSTQGAKSRVVLKFPRWL